MLAPTHSVFAVFLTLTLLAFFGVKYSLHWTILLSAIIGAILPDIDHQSSVIGRLFSPISKRIERRFQHRTITHSLLGWAIASLLFGSLVLLGLWIYGLLSDFGFRISYLVPRWIAAFAIGYLSHIILDMVNKRGVNLFWPDKTRDVIPKDPKLRFESGAKPEAIIFLSCLILMFLSLPISRYGVGTTLRWLLATSGSAIEEFKSTGRLSYLEFSGRFRDTKKPISTLAEILDTKSQKVIILLDGGVYTVSDKVTADIVADKMRVVKSGRRLRVEYYEFQDEERKDLLERIPERARLTGVIDLPRGLKVKVPYARGSIKPFEQLENQLQLNYVTKEMLESLALEAQYQLQRKRDLLKMDTLKFKVEQLRDEIEKVKNSSPFTPEAEKRYMSDEKIKKRDNRVKELEIELQEVLLALEEMKLKLKENRFLFSGYVYVRH